ncbi:MAG: glutathione peroxidase [Clostridiales bacterium]|jgi:glutathione peroxidase|nr:glutathione peroxidase [Pygmaiobacter sp.]MDK2813482.1 glutathione peroxidase [Clostridiales bacterium]
MNIYDFEVTDMNGTPKLLAEYQGKVLLIVNTASKCGFTPQYEGLEALYKKYKGQGLVVLGFPSNQFLEQDPGSNEEISEFCKVNYGVTFPLFSKIEVRGPGAHPLYRFLTKQAPFRGFEMDKEMGRKIESVVREHYPENLNGDEIKWNFTKFLVSRDGAKITRYEPTVTPQELDAIIQKAL